MCLVPFLMLLMMHLSHIYQPWQLDRQFKIFFALIPGAARAPGAGGAARHGERDQLPALRYCPRARGRHRRHHDAPPGLGRAGRLPVVGGCVPRQPSSLNPEP